MPWGILLYQNVGMYYSLVMADDTLYNSMKKEMKKAGMEILDGKKGISDDRINDISSKIDGIVAKLNKCQGVVLKELEQAFI